MKQAPYPPHISPFRKLAALTYLFGNPTPSAFWPACDGVPARAQGSICAIVHMEVAPPPQPGAWSAPEPRAITMRPAPSAMGDALYATAGLNGMAVKYVYYVIGVSGTRHEFSTSPGGASILCPTPATLPDLQRCLHLGCGGRNRYASQCIVEYLRHLSEWT